MYKQVKTDSECIFFNGEKFHPVATLADEYGGRCQIHIDDHCYQLSLIQKDGRYRNTAWIFAEAFEVLKTLPSLSNFKEREIKDYMVNAIRDAERRNNLRKECVKKDSEKGECEDLEEIKEIVKQAIDKIPKNNPSFNSDGKLEELEEPQTYIDSKNIGSILCRNNNQITKILTNQQLSQFLADFSDKNFPIMGGDTEKIFAEIIRRLLK